MTEIILTANGAQTHRHRHTFTYGHACIVKNKSLRICLILTPSEEWMRVGWGEVVGAEEEEGGETEVGT